MRTNTPVHRLTTFDLMDGMRALAAGAVVVNHIRNLVFLDYPTGLSTAWKAFYFVTGFGHQAVMIFFVLSGFWIAKTVARRSLQGDFDWGEYAIDRLSRLWIVLLPALLLGGILDVIGRYGIEAPLYLGMQGTNTISTDIAGRLNIVTALGNMFFLQTLLVHTFGSNGPLWSLANEFWYYLWFPCLRQLSAKKRWSIVAAGVAVVSMVAFHQLLIGFACWLCGALLFYATQRVRGRLFARGIPLLALGSCLFVGFLTASRLPRAFISPDEQDIAISVSFALLLYALIRMELNFPSWLSPLARYGSGSSYSLYVSHFPFVALLTAAFLAPAHRLAPTLALLLVFAGMASAALLYGYVVSRLTEARTSTVRRWLKRRYTGFVYPLSLGADRREL